MVRAVAEEALALTSITLFLAMVAVWVQVLGVACAIPMAAVTASAKLSVRGEV